MRFLPRKLKKCSCVNWLFFFWAWEDVLHIGQKFLNGNGRGQVTSHPHFPFHLLKLNFTSRAPEKAKRKVKVESGGKGREKLGKPGSKLKRN